MSKDRKEEMPIADAESVSAADVASLACAELGIEKPVRRVPEPEKVAA